MGRSSKGYLLRATSVVATDTLVEITGEPAALTDAFANCFFGARDVDLPVEVTWERLNDDISLPLFRPAGGAP